MPEIFRRAGYRGWEENNEAYPENQPLIVSKYRYTFSHREGTVAVREKCCTFPGRNLRAETATTSICCNFTPRLGVHFLASRFTVLLIRRPATGRYFVYKFWLPPDHRPFPCTPQPLLNRQQFGCGVVSPLGEDPWPPGQRTAAVELSPGAFHDSRAK